MAKIDVTFELIESALFRLAQNPVTIIEIVDINMNRRVVTMEIVGADVPLAERVTADIKISRNPQEIGEMVFKELQRA